MQKKKKWEKIATKYNKLISQYEFQNATSSVTKNCSQIAFEYLIMIGVLYIFSSYTRDCTI